MQNIVAALSASSSSIALVVVAIAPTIVLLSYLYVRDKYEKEPLALLAKAFLFGCLSVLPVIVVELQLTRLNTYAGLMGTAFDAFVVAGLVEEVFKLVAVYLAVYRSPHFNEPYDGVIYAASASLGFATIENIGYVLSHGLGTGINRAILAVPGHALWGIAMGFYMGAAKFAPAPRRPRLWLLSLVIPITLHGVYDLIAYNMNTIFSILMYPLVAYLWVTGLRQIDRASAASPFRLFGVLSQGATHSVMAGGAASTQPLLTDVTHLDVPTAGDYFDDDQSDVDEQDLLFVPPTPAHQESGDPTLKPCPICRDQVHVGAEVCPHCGLPLAVCRVCHTPVPAATKFCSECGNALR